MTRIEVECGRCKKRHVVKTLCTSLYCCSFSKGVRKLIGEVRGETGERYFVVTKGTTVRVYIGHYGSTKSGAGV